MFVTYFVGTLFFYFCCCCIFLSFSLSRLYQPNFTFIMQTHTQTHIHDILNKMHFELKLVIGMQFDWTGSMQQGIYLHISELYMFLFLLFLHFILKSYDMRLIYKLICFERLHNLHKDKPLHFFSSLLLFFFSSEKKEEKNRLKLDLCVLHS